MLEAAEVVLDELTAAMTFLVVTEGAVAAVASALARAARLGRPSQVGQSSRRE